MDNALEVGIAERLVVGVRPSGVLHSGDSQTRSVSVATGPVPQSARTGERRGDRKVACEELLSLPFAVWVAAAGA